MGTDNGFYTRLADQLWPVPEFRFETGKLQDLLVLQHSEATISSIHTIMR